MNFLGWSDFCFISHLGKGKQFHEKKILNLIDRCKKKFWERSIELNKRDCA